MKKAILLSTVLILFLMFFCLALAEEQTNPRRQHVEDTAAAVVQEQDAQVSPQLLAPQGVLVVEETEVADDAEDG